MSSFQLFAFYTFHILVAVVAGSISVYFGRLLSKGDKSIRVVGGIWSFGFICGFSSSSMFMFTLFTVL